MRYLKVVNTVLCLLVVFNHNIEIDTKLQKVLLKICRKHFRFFFENSKYIST